jgi:hypothetical protein
MHHYLPKKVPQTKVKFYQIDRDTLNIDDEHFFVAETLEGNSNGGFDEQPTYNRKSKNMLYHDVHHLFTLIESNKEREAARKKAK